LLKASHSTTPSRSKEELDLLGCQADIAEGAPRSAPGKRKPIPEHVRHEVWRRDEGKCVDCGSRDRLHFDHIVPVSKGGSNTVRNIELRCESCNLRKGAKI
jgi:HNH endonuclease